MALRRVWAYLLVMDFSTTTKSNYGRRIHIYIYMLCIIYTRKPLMGFCGIRFMYNIYIYIYINHLKVCYKSIVGFSSPQEQK